MDFRHSLPATQFITKRIETSLTYSEGNGNQTISDSIKFYFAKTCENDVGSFHSFFFLKSIHRK